MYIKALERAFQPSLVFNKLLLCMATASRNSDAARLKCVLSICVFIKLLGEGDASSLCLMF